MEWNANMTAFPYDSDLYLTELKNAGIISRDWINDNKDCICSFMLPPQYAWAYNVLKFNTLFTWASITFRL